jgi:hypothetical protein
MPDTYLTLDFSIKGTFPTQQLGVNEAIRQPRTTLEQLGYDCHSDHQHCSIL